MTLTVGFDLDMTLVDARAGIRATYRALSAQTGVHIDAEAAIARLGPPLTVELGHWFPPAQVEAAVRAYRALYGGLANQDSRLLPGAAAAVAAVRRHGGRVVVVTSKLGRFARAHLDHLGLAVDEVAGDRFGDGKVAALTDYRAGVYVGDHVADVRAGRAAGATTVGVATGPCSRAELAAAGADTVLADLTGFPDWLDDRFGLA
jgi:phosphoglycolate phosphatase